MCGSPLPAPRLGKPREQLVVHCQSSLVPWELVPQWSGHCAALCCVKVEEGVEVWQKCVSRSEGASHYRGNFLPKNGRVLLNGPKGVVIPRERIEGTKLVPPSAQFGLGVADESADVCPNKRDPKLVEL